MKQKRTKRKVYKYTKKDEFWKVLDGYAQVELKYMMFSAFKGDRIENFKNLKH